MSSAGLFFLEIPTGAIQTSRVVPRGTSEIGSKPAGTEPALLANVLVFLRTEVILLGQSRVRKRSVMKVQLLSAGGGPSCPIPLPYLSNS